MFPTSSRDPLYVYHFCGQSFMSVENARNVNPAGREPGDVNGVSGRSSFYVISLVIPPCECGNVTNDCLHDATPTVLPKPQNSRRNWVDSTEVRPRTRRLAPELIMIAS